MIDACITGEKMKKVLIWGMTSNWGGIESVLYNYVINSNKDIIQFDFITTFPSIPRADELEKNGSSIYFLPDRKKDFFSYKKALNFFMKKNANKYDAVWLNDCMFGNIDILKISKRYNINKRIIHAHNSNSLGGGASRYIRHKINSIQLHRYVTDYWACSQLAGEWSFSPKILSSNKYKVINNAIDSYQYKYDLDIRNRKKKELGIKEDIRVIGHIGRFDYQKNHLYLLDIYHEYIIKHPETILICIGTGTDFEKVKEYAENKGLINNILFLGQRNDVKELLQAFDMFLLPSRFEGLPVVVVEALASGLPCFISDKITSEVAIIPRLVNFISIEEKPSEWVRIIDDKMNGFKRENTQREIIDSGYDIVDEARKLEELF